MLGMAEMDTLALIFFGPFLMGSMIVSNISPHKLWKSPFAATSHFAANM